MRPYFARRRMACSEITFAIGWCEPDSAAAARDMNAAMVIPSGTRSVICGSPSVRISGFPRTSTSAEDAASTARRLRREIPLSSSNAAPIQRGIDSASGNTQGATVRIRKRQKATVKGTETPSKLHARPERITIRSDKRAA